MSLEDHRSEMHFYSFLLFKSFYFLSPLPLNAVNTLTMAVSIEMSHILARVTRHHSPQSAITSRNGLSEKVSPEKWPWSHRPEVPVGF